MNSKKIWSFLLLIAISFSLAHDYAFVILDNDHHSVQEYTSELTTHDLNKDGFKHDIHNECHVIGIYVAEIPFFSNAKKIESSFQYNDVFLSRSHFNLLKPPIA